jgi:hypothetical protein
VAEVLAEALGKGLRHFQKSATSKDDRKVSKRLRPSASRSRLRIQRFSSHISMEDAMAWSSLAALSECFVSRAGSDSVRGAVQFAYRSINSGVFSPPRRTHISDRILSHFAEGSYRGVIRRRLARDLSSAWPRGAPCICS